MCKKFSLNKRRGVSNIIGSLIVLALVASVGSIILFQGLNQINTFNYDLTFFDKTKNAELREDVIFEHVRFDNSTGNEKNVELYLANIGTVPATIISVTMIHIESQEIVLAWDNVEPSETNDNTATIQLDSNKIITLTADLLCPAPCVDPEWNDDYYRTSKYSLSITTSKGNFFPPNSGHIVEPWNT